MPIKLGKCNFYDGVTTCPYCCNDCFKTCAIRCENNKNKCHGYKPAKKEQPLITDTKVLQLWDKGNNARQIAEKLECTLGIVQHRLERLRKADLIAPRRKERIDWKAMEPKIIELYKQGNSGALIASKLQISDSAVTKRIRQLKENNIL